MLLVCRCPVRVPAGGSCWLCCCCSCRGCADHGVGSPEQLSPGGCCDPQEQGSLSCAWPGRAGRNLLPGHSPGAGIPHPEPAALGTQGWVKGTKRHPGSCPALGSVLCSCKHPHGQTPPVSIRDFVFPGWRERQMSVCLGLAGWLFVFEIPNWAQLREGCWGSPSALTGDRAGGTCAPLPVPDAFTCTEGNQSTVFPCSWELRS